MVSETTNSYETQSFHTAKNDSIIESVYTAQQTEKKSHQNKSEIAKEEIVEIGEKEGFMDTFVSSCTKALSGDQSRKTLSMQFNHTGSGLTTSQSDNNNDCQNKKNDSVALENLKIQCDLE